MKAKAKIKDIIPGLKGSTLILETDARASMFENVMNKELSVDMEEYSADRTLSMNAYYWQLLTKLSRDKHINRSIPATHNLMLIRYCAIPDTYKGQTIIVYYDADVDVYEFERLHLLPITGYSVNEDGKLMCKYQVLKGSHELTKKQFTMLLDGLIDECKVLGIETATPDELERIKAIYER